MSAGDCILAFRRAMESSGIVFKGDLKADGDLHRVHVEGDKKKGSLNGWYVLHLDGVPAGAFGHWSTTGELSHKWSAKGSVEMSAEEGKRYREEVKAAKAAREAKEREDQAKAAVHANAVWDAAQPAPADHPYLTRKGVQVHGLRVADWIKEYVDRETGEIKRRGVRNALLVPIYGYQDGKKALVSIQAIFPSSENKLKRDKDFLTDGQKRGCYYTIGRPIDVDGVQTIAICEGYATGASIFEATGIGAIVAFDAGNLQPVAEAFRAKFPAMRLVFAADNDQWTTEPINNPGVARAKQAATAAGEPSVVAIPLFASLDDKPTDFNDMAQREGKHAVRSQIMGTIGLKWGPAQAEASAAAADPAPGASTTSEAEAEAHDKAQLSAVDSGKYFVILGYDYEDYFVFQHESRQVLRINSGSLKSDEGRRELARPLWWTRNFPGTRGVDATAAIDWFVTVARSRGIYDPSKVRGRGAWLDDGRMVFHFGNTLMVEGKNLDVTQIRSEYVYELRRKLPYPSADPLSDADGRRLAEMAKRFRFMNPASAYLLLGWTALAPICGALRWRPHAWLTGEPGSGKSYIQNDFVGWLMGGISLYCQGNSTEAGIRQRLKRDAIPVLYDEGEQNEKSEMTRMQAVLSLARQSSTESEALTVKGTIDGEGQDYLIRSMFLLASIQVGIKQQADHERIAKLVLKPKKDASNSRDNWWAMKAEMLDLKKDKTLPARLISRSMKLLPITLQNAEVFAEVAADHLGSQREGDQYGFLLAGYWSLVNDGLVTKAAAEALVKQFSWTDYLEDAEVRHSTNVLAAILGKRLTIDGGRHLTVYELVARAAGLEVPNMGLDPDAANAVLRRYGMKVVASTPGVPASATWLLQNNSAEVTKLFADTTYGADWRGQLIQVDGAVKHRKTERFNGQPMKCIALSLRDILAEDPDPGRDHVDDDLPF